MVANLSAEVSEVKKLLLQQVKPQQSEFDALLTVQEAARFLSLSVPTVYGLTSKGELPVMKRGKRCYFTKQELMQYLKEGRKKTNVEIKQLAENYLKAKQHEE